jgi:MtN3 and saliva related transmembrane protein
VNLSLQDSFAGARIIISALPHPLPVTVLGYAAASLTSLSFFPQAYKTLRSGDTRALSLPMCLLRTSALAIWLLYGVFSQSGPIVVANGLALMPMALVLERKLRNRRHEGLDPIPKR